VCDRFALLVTLAFPDAKGALPEAVTFAFVSNVKPMIGLYATFIMGLVTALIGARPSKASIGTMAIVIEQKLW